MNRVPHVENGYTLIMFNYIDFAFYAAKKRLPTHIVTDCQLAHSNLGSNVFIRLLVIQLYATRY